MPVCLRMRRSSSRSRMRSLASRLESGSSSSSSCGSIDQAARQGHALHLAARQRGHRPVGVVERGRPAPACRRPSCRCCRRRRCCGGTSADRPRSGAPSCAATRRRTGTPCRCRDRAASTSTPRPGSQTTRSPIEMRPPVGCSSPATQRKVVVLPQPEGPSRTTISPAGTSKLTPSTAGLPAAKRFSSFSISSAAVTGGIRRSCSTPRATGRAASRTARSSAPTP